MRWRAGREWETEGGKKEKEKMREGGLCKPKNPLSRSPKKAVVKNKKRHTRMLQPFSLAAPAYAF